MQKRLYFISFLLSFLFSLNIYATDTSGKITITLSNIPLSEAIAKIEAASQYTFFYDVNKTNLEQRVSLRAQELEVEDAISRLLKNTDLTFNITNRQIVLIPPPPDGSGTSSKNSYRYGSRRCRRSGYRCQCG
ncbi:MAG: STN domain-containing protein [Tannerellaceae bacterium]|nr:STN domain-containing protein [Tannerellaceae bacterium]